MENDNERSFVAESTTLPPPRLIELGTLRELIRGEGSGQLDVASNCTVPGVDAIAPPGCGD